MIKLNFSQKEKEQIKEAHAGQPLKLYKYTFQPKGKSDLATLEVIMKEATEASRMAYAESLTTSPLSATQDFIADNALGREREEFLKFLGEYFLIAPALMKRYSEDFGGSSRREVKAEDL